MRLGGVEAHASVNRTCEFGMSLAAGQAHRRLLELVEEATR